MDAVWYGIADFFQFIFKYLPPIGPLANLFFIFAIAGGIIYWLWYDAKVNRGGKNYMAEKAKENN